MTIRPLVDFSRLNGHDRIALMFSGGIQQRREARATLRLLRELMRSARSEHGEQDE